MPQIPFSGILIASVAAGILSASMLIANLINTEARIYLEPAEGVLHVGDTVTLQIKAAADIPVNVFKGILRFNPAYIQVERIDYNVSIADLWAEEPWYENGEGTLSFIGGSTRAGGFKGSDTLITVTFKSIAAGPAAMSLTDIRILQHDGLGTEADIDTPIDALFTVTPEVLNEETVTTQRQTSSDITILPIGITTDLNKDGFHTITDISIFMRHLSTQNTRSDFNGDGIVSTKDLSIILNQ